jgi:tetratricopeptide (TPR) repeat protein
MTQPTRAAVQDALRQAQMSFNQGNFSAAEPIYKQMVETIPPESEEYALCLHNLGEINEQRGNLTTAIWWQQRLITHDLMTHSGMVNHLFYRMAHIAALYTRAGRPSEANALYQQMDALRPRLTEQLPPGFEPQSEVGNFLKGLFDSVYRKYASDQAEGEQTRAALSQLNQFKQSAQGVPAPGGQIWMGQPASVNQPEYQGGIVQPEVYSPQHAGQSSHQQAPQAAYQPEYQEYQEEISQPGIEGYQPHPDYGYEQKQTPRATQANMYGEEESQGVEEWKANSDAKQLRTDSSRNYESRASGPSIPAPSMPKIPMPGIPMPGISMPAASMQQSTPGLPAGGSRDFGSNDLESIPTPARDAKKPSVSRARQQDISPEFLKKEDTSNAYVPNAPQQLKPAGKMPVAQPEWEAPRRGRAPKIPKPKKFKRDSIMTEDDFAPKRRIGMTEADSLDAAPTELNSNLQGLATAWTQLSNSKNAPIIFLGVVAFVIIGVFQMPYRGKPVAQFNGMPKRFRTVDGTKQFTLLTLTDCEIDSGKDMQRIPYKFYFGDWREAVFLAFGQLPEKQYWLTDKKSALADAGGMTFYDAGGAERKLYTAMEAISRAVAQYYVTHDKKYPSSGEDIGAAELTYENPYTKQNSVADIQSVAIGDATTKAGEKARASIYGKLSEGESWDNEKKLTPGAINCLSAQIMTSRGPIMAFFMQAADENGKPIMGSNPKESCYFALEDGKTIYEKSEPLPYVTDGTIRKKLVVVLEQPISSLMSYIIRNAACWLFSFMAFIAAAFFLALPKRSPGKVVAIGLIVIFGAVAVMYCINNRL